MRKFMVAGNWKMHGSQSLCEELTGAASSMSDLTGQVDVVMCPPFPYLGAVVDGLAGSGVVAGAQNLSNQSGDGAYTGEVNARMLRESGCSHVIVGHSERRSYYGEDNELVAEKTAVALEAGLVPLVCIGEALEERESGQMEAVLAAQLDAVVAKVGISALADAVIAYEPVWAIGTGVTASPQQAQDVHAFLRQRLVANDATIAAEIRILYGGSVKGNNAQELFSCPDVDGGLIGGASLDAEQFSTICKAAATLS